MHFIKLIRPLNLFIIALTAICTVYLIGARLLENNGIVKDVATFHEHFHLIDFILLIGTMVFSAAAGNIINDYFDMRADRINKPNQVIIGKHIKRRWAILGHWVFNSLAIIIALYLGWKYKNIWFFVFPFLSTILLWFYSMVLKKKVLLGNIAIAFLSGIVPFLAGIFLMEFYVNEMKETPIEIYWMGSAKIISLRTWVWAWVLFLSIYAFALTLIREIIKDMADIDGDKVIHCQTLPIKYGLKKTKIILVILNFLVSFSLAVLSAKFILYYEGFSLYFSWVIWILILLPLFASLIFSISTQDRDQMVRSGQIIKLSMLGGLILMGMI